jgi:hypothetical protein
MRLSGGSSEENDENDNMNDNIKHERKVLPTEFDLCSITNPCKNGGTCEMDENHSDFICKCPNDWVGKVCETKSPCEFIECHNGGTCTVISSMVYSCKCAPGFTGINCKSKATLRDGRIIKNNNNTLGYVFQSTVRLNRNSSAIINNNATQSDVVKSESATQLDV